jgi:hypothetical protein
LKKGVHKPPRAEHVRSSGSESFEYGQWMMKRSFLIVPSQAVVGKWLESFKEYPIRQKPASFNLDAVMEKLTTPTGAK